MDNKTKHIGDLIVDEKGDRWIVSSVHYANGKVNYGKVREGSLAANVLFDALKAKSEKE